MLPSQSCIDQNIDLDKACLWGDPVDCTLGYINGNIEDVTVQVGLSYNNKPVAGVIGTPYKLIDGKKVFDPVVTIGSIKEKQVFDFFGKEWKVKPRKFPINKPIKLATSNSRSSQSEN